MKHSANLLFAAYLESCKLPHEDYAQSDDAGIAGVATLLYGLAMENLLKAVLLSERIAKVEASGKVEWNANGATSHDLLEICRSSNLVGLDAEQEKLMERMSAFVYWAGKYPTPLRFKDEKTKKHYKGFLLSGQPDAGAVMLPVAFSVSDKDSFEAIYRGLWNKAAVTIRRKARKAK